MKNVTEPSIATRTSKVLVAPSAQVCVVSTQFAEPVFKSGGLYKL